MSEGQHHRKLAWITAGGLGIALVSAIVGMTVPPGGSLWHMIAAPEEDGSWKFVKIDGVDVRGAGYSIGLRWGEIISWNNGCNSCGTTGDGAAICTLQACEELPTNRLFYLWPRSDPNIELQGDHLILTLPGHRAQLVRERKN